MNMNIEQVIKEKCEVEAQILLLLDGFRLRTGLAVRSVDLTLLDVDPVAGNTEVLVTGLKIDVRLP